MSDGIKGAANQSKIICKASTIVSHVHIPACATANLEKFKKT